MIHYVADAPDRYASVLASLLEPGGRLLNHGIARLHHGDSRDDGFLERYAFPADAPLHLSRLLLALERVGFVCEHIEGFGEHCARTLAIWRSGSTTTPRRQSGPSRRSGCACGGCTCARRAASSRPGWRRSTTCARAAPERAHRRHAAARYSATDDRPRSGFVSREDAARP